MADTDVKSSSSLGAIEPPLPPPSAAPDSPLPDASMRVNHVQPLPTTSSAYRAIANLNRGFEQLAQNCRALQEFNFFPGDDLIAWTNMIGRMRAEANQTLMEVLDHREMNNALYYDRLSLQREREIRDPDDVLLEAEHRKREVAEEQKRRGDQSEETT